MTMYYSRGLRGFFDPSIHHLPADALEISSQDHCNLLAGQSASKRIIPDVDGRPTLSDAPEPTEAALAAQRRAAITVELTAIDAASARPLRAILYAQAHGLTPGPADVARIAELEAQAVALRAQRV